MLMNLKWLFLVLLAGFVWLITDLVEEYFRPYKKVKIRMR
jgi:Na+-transporting methylmalonyl-CoA/oxaloacetate decarboxylase gamma subunit